MRLGRERIGSVLAIVAAAFLLSAARPGAGDAPGDQSLAGQFLVATPEMGDPRFAETVILLVRHDKTGALGIVINRPVAERSLAALMEELGQKDPDAQGTVRIFAGGPVESSIGFVIHSAEYHRAETMAVDEHVSVTSSPEILRDIGRGAGPKKALVAFGYAGWGPGQLENEIAEHGWFTEPEDPKLLFDVERSVVWKEALSRRSRDL
jgi:putative transcriptional regulator